MFRKHARSLSFIFGIPAGAFILLSIVYWHQETSWMADLRESALATPENRLELLTLDAVCLVPGAPDDIQRRCRDHRVVAFSDLLALITIGSLLLLMVGIHYVGQRSRKDGGFLLRAFGIGNRVMTVVTLLAVLSQASLLVVVLYYLPDEFLSGRIPGGLIFLTALGAVLAVYQGVRLLLSFNADEPINQDGRCVSATEAPELWGFVMDIASAVGADVPRNILVGVSATFFVTESRVTTNSEKTEGRTLYLSIPLCRILTRAELRSIIGHEMGHFHGGDTEFTRRFYPMFRRSSTALDAVGDTAKSVGAGGYALLPAFFLLSFYLSSFSEAEAALSRQREIRADSIGASTTSKHDFAIALTKLVQNEPVWDSVYAELLNNTSNDRSTLKLLSESFSEIADRKRSEVNREDEIRRLESERLSHPTDSHPILCDRLAALGLTLAEIYDAAGAIHPADPGSALIPGVDAMERELIPEFAPKSEQASVIFCRRQAGFPAIEYYGFILNRSFVIYVHNDGLYGLKFCGMIDASNPTYFEPMAELLDNPWLFPGSKEFSELMKTMKGGFFLPFKEIVEVQFDSSPKWGMGKIPHTGKLVVKLKSGRKRVFILLGTAYGDGIRRVIAEAAHIA